MSTENNAAIVAIGAVMFDREGLGDNFYRTVSLGSSMKKGLHVSAKSIKWWLQQSDTARSFLFKNEFPLGRALKEFEVFLAEQDELLNAKDNVKTDLKVWSNGSNFDIVILENALRVCNIRVPWSYKNVRCFRTFRKTHPELKSSVINNIAQSVVHNALDDATWQATYVKMVWGCGTSFGD